MCLKYFVWKPGSCEPVISPGLFWRLNQSPACQCHAVCQPSQVSMWNYTTVWGEADVMPFFWTQITCHFGVWGYHCCQSHRALTKCERPSFPWLRAQSLSVQPSVRTGEAPSFSHTVWTSGMWLGTQNIANGESNQRGETRGSGSSQACSDFLSDVASERSGAPGSGGSLSVVLLLFIGLWGTVIHLSCSISPAQDWCVSFFASAAVLSGVNW